MRARDLLPRRQAIVASAEPSTERPRLRVVTGTEVERKYAGKPSPLQEAITAAAQVMNDGPQNEGMNPNAVTPPCQHAAWGYCLTVPELKAAMMYVVNALSQCSLAVGIMKPDGSV